VCEYELEVTDAKTLILASRDVRCDSCGHRDLGVLPSSNGWDDLGKRTSHFERRVPADAGIFSQPFG
jgi:hypothetical protein